MNFKRCTFTIVLSLLILSFYVGFADCKVTKKKITGRAKYKSKPVRKARKISPDTLYIAAISKFEAGDTAGSIENLAMIITKFPSDTFADMARLMIGSIMIQKGEYNRAISFLSGRWNDEDRYGVKREILMNRCYEAMGLIGMEYIGWMRLATFFTGDSMTFRDAEGRAAKMRFKVKSREIAASVLSEGGEKDTTKISVDTTTKQGSVTQSPQKEKQ